MKRLILLLIILTIFIFTVSCNKEEVVTENDTTIKVESEKELNKKISELEEKNSSLEEKINELNKRLVELENFNELIVQENSKMQNEIKESLNKSQLYLRESDKFRKLGGGLTIGSNLNQVIEILGEEYKEEELIGDGGYSYGENLKSLVYKDTGISLGIGEDSEQVYYISVYSNSIETTLGAKVGDNAFETFKKYDKLYKGYVEKSYNNKLIGWYVLEPDTVIIFDISKDDHKIINDDVNQFSTIEAIYLLYSPALN